MRWFFQSKYGFADAVESGLELKSELKVEGNSIQRAIKDKNKWIECARAMNLDQAN